MKIIENSARRLELRLDGAGVAGGHCVFDRDTGEAEITRSLFGILPYLRKKLSLAQIATITVKRPTNRKRYRPTLQLTMGEDIPIASLTKEEALDAAKTIRDFLRGKRPAA